MSIIQDRQELLRLTQEVQKFNQETQYVCLKLGVRDWTTFLAQVRKGCIMRTLQGSSPSSQNTANIPTNKSKTKEPAAQTIKKTSNKFEILNEVLQIKPTKRHSQNNRNCGCQSPICSEERIKHIKGSDTSRSESSCMENLAQQHVDPFEKFKIENLCGDSKNHKAIQVLMKTFEQYEKTQTVKQVPAFDTFRKITSEGKGANKDVFLSDNRNHNQRTKKRHQDSPDNIYSQSLERVNSDEWINKQSFQMEDGMKQFLLALENTRLRKEIKCLQKMLNSQSQNQGNI